MTPMRAVLGAVVAAAAVFAVVQSVNSPGPKYLGDFPSTMAHAQPAAAPITHASPGPVVPDPPHYAAQPAIPEQPAAAPADPAAPAPVGPSVPVGSGRTAGPSNAQPGTGSPVSGLVPDVGLLSGVLSKLPTLDLSKYCMLGTTFVPLPCSQVPGGVPLP